MNADHQFSLLVNVVIDSGKTMVSGNQRCFGSTVSMRRVFLMYDQEARKRSSTVESPSAAGNVCSSFFGPECAKNRGIVRAKEARASKEGQRSHLACRWPHFCPFRINRVALHIWRSLWNQAISRFTVRPSQSLPDSEQDVSLYVLLPKN